jgi:hypothetical protein
VITHAYLPGVAGKETCSVLDLLRAAPCFHGKEASAYGFMPQCMWTLGPLVDSSLLELPFELRRSSSDWVDKSTLICVGKASGRNDVHFCLSVYMEENASVLRVAMDLGFAVDDGRMGMGSSGGNVSGQKNTGLQNLISGRRLSINGAKVIPI